MPTPLKVMATWLPGSLVPFITIEGVTTFPGVGTLTFGGEMKSMKDGTVHVRVVKGTGSFKGARGMLIIGEGSQKAPNTYVLKLPHPIPEPGSA